MAITINSSPEGFASFNDDMWYVVTSTNATTTNMKYVFDIRINSVLVARLKVFPDPTTDKGIVNIANIIRNYWSSYFLPSSTRTAFNYNGLGNIVNYTIQFGEDLNGTVTTNLQQEINYAYNFAPPAFRDYSTSYYATKVDDFITNRDRNELTIYGDEKLFISYAPSIPGDASLAITVNNGTSSMTGDGVFLSGVQLLDISPAALNAYLGTTFITSATQSYTVTISADTVRVRRVCAPYEPVLVHFLNELGGYDTFPFRLVNRESRTVERKTYQRKEWQLSGTTMRPYDANKRMNGGTVQFGTLQHVKYGLTSEYVTETDYTWLRELIVSPEVYFERGGYYYPAKVNNQQWEQKLRRNDKLFNLTLDVDILTTNAQYR